MNDLIGRPQLTGGATGTQREAWNIKDFKTFTAVERELAQRDADGQTTIFGDVIRHEPKPQRKPKSDKPETPTLF